MSDAALCQRIKEILIEQARIRVGAPKAGGAVSGGADSGGKLRKSRKGGDWASFVNTMNHPDTWGAKIQNEITNPDSDLRAKIIPVASRLRRWRDWECTAPTPRREPLVPTRRQFRRLCVPTPA